jgi:membrane protease YdiL (CAAX protease family)
LNSLSIKIRYAAEVFLELAFIFSYVWYIERNTPDAFRFTFFYGACVAFPLACIALEQRGHFPEFSLDWDVFVRGLRSVVWFTVAGSAFMICVAAYFDSWNYDDNIAGRVFEYVFWSFLQQIGLQTFLTRRFEKIFVNPLWVCAASSTVFALIHFPNPVLMVLTWVGGFFWTWCFLKTPNLYALAVSHGWLAVMAIYCVPVRWLHQLRVGPGYWTFNP